MSHVGQLSRALKASKRSSSVSGCRRTADCMSLRLKKSGAIHRQVSQSARDREEVTHMSEAGDAKTCRHETFLKLVSHSALAA